MSSDDLAALCLVLVLEGLLLFAAPSAWKRIAGGCHMNRDIPALLEGSGFEFETLESMYIPGPRVLSYNYWGAATGR